MTEIKTAQAWGHIYKSDDVLMRAAEPTDGSLHDQVVIVHGLTEAEVHKAAALLEKSREVCECTKQHYNDLVGLHRWLGKVLGAEDAWVDSLALFLQKQQCPSCGRKVVVK